MHSFTKNKLVRKPSAKLFDGYKPAGKFFVRINHHVIYFS